MGDKIHLRIAEDLKKVSRVLFFLDYDGTLTRIRKKPREALLPASTRGILKTLSRKKWARVYIVTGRTLKDIRRLVGIRSINYVGNHGFELSDTRLVYRNAKAERSKKTIARIYRELKKSLKIKNAIIENKYYTLSVHYRLVNKDEVDKFKKRFYNIAGRYKKTGAIVITPGKKILEIRPNIRWDKGAMVKWIAKKLAGKRDLTVYVGDDRTDEDAFRALGKKAVTVFVSKKKARRGARFGLASPEEVRDFLKGVIYLKHV